MLSPLWLEIAKTLMSLTFLHSSHPDQHKVKSLNREEIDRWLIEEIPCYSTERHKISVLHNDKFIGQLTIRNFEREMTPSTAIIGYWIDKRYQGRGYATASLKYATQYALKNLDVERIDALIHEDNHASIQVAKKAGYSLTTLEKLAMYHGGTFDLHLRYSCDILG